MTQPSSKRRERRARLYSLLLIEARLLGGGKNLRPIQPNDAQIRDLRLYIEDLRRKI